MEQVKITDSSKNTPEAPRKTPITQAQFDQVCKIISTSTLSVHKAAKSIGIGTQSVYEYMVIVGQTAKDQYARAKDDQCDWIGDEMQDLADNCEDSNKGRLQVDTRKWYLSKIKPKRYGEHQTIEIVSTLNSISEAMLQVIRQYVPADKQSDAVNAVQTAIDFQA